MTITLLTNLAKINQSLMYTEDVQSKQLFRLHLLPSNISLVLVLFFTTQLHNFVLNLDA